MMNYLRIGKLLGWIAFMISPAFVHAQWTTVGDEVEMTDIGDDVLIGATSNSNNSKFKVRTDVLRETLIYAEAAYDVAVNRELLRLVLPSTSSSSAEFVDMKKDGDTVFEVDRDGDVNIAGDVDVVGELTAASDARFKEDVTNLEGALDKIMKLRPVSYNFKAEQFPGLKFPTRRKQGLIAQEVEKVLPSMVSNGREVTDMDGNAFNSKSVNYIEMIPFWMKAIQEQQLVIEELRHRLDKAENK